MVPTLYHARTSDPDQMTLTSNADMTGIAVVVANVVVCFCSRILVSWSAAGIDSGVRASLIQSYPILLSTLLIANRGQMCANDANYATIITSPPLMVYLTISSILDLLGVETDLYQRIGSHRRIIRVFGALILPIWFLLSLIIGTSNRAFYNGKGGEGWMFWWWWNLPIVLLTSAYGFIGLGFISFPALFLYRRWAQVMADFQAYRKGLDEPRKWRRLWWVVKCTCALMRCAWRTVDRNHKWFVYCLLVSLDCAWVCWVVVVAMPLSWHVYTLTYGQLLSIFAAAPPLISVGQLVCANRSDLLRSIRHFPSRVSAEVRYLIIGIEPGAPTPVRDSPPSIDIASYPEKPTLSRLRDQITTSVRSTYQPLLLSEPGSAMWWEAGGDDCSRSCASTLVGSVCDEVR